MEAELPCRYTEEYALYSGHGSSLLSHGHLKVLISSSTSSLTEFSGNGTLRLQIWGPSFVWLKYCLFGNSEHLLWLLLPLVGFRTDWTSYKFTLDLSIWSNSSPLHLWPARWDADLQTCLTAYIWELEHSFISGRLNLGGALKKTQKLFFLLVFRHLQFCAVSV